MIHLLLFLLSTLSHAEGISLDLRPDKILANSRIRLIPATNTLDLANTTFEKLSKKNPGCDIRSIQGKIAIHASCFKAFSGLEVDLKPGAYILKLQSYSDQSIRAFEYVLYYKSGERKSSDFKISAFYHPGGKEFAVNRAHFPRLHMGEEPVQIYWDRSIFHTPIRSEFYHKQNLYDKTLGRFQHLKPPLSQKRKKLDRSNVTGLFERDFYIVSLEFVPILLDSSKSKKKLFEFLKSDSQQLIQWYHLSLALVLIPLLFSTRYLSLQISLAFLMPVFFLSIFQIFMIKPWQDRALDVKYNELINENYEKFLRHEEGLRLLDEFQTSFTIQISERVKNFMRHIDYEDLVKRVKIFTRELDQLSDTNQPGPLKKMFDLGKQGYLDSLKQIEKAGYHEISRNPHFDYLKNSEFDAKNLSHSKYLCQSLLNQANPLTLLLQYFTVHEGVTVAITNGEIYISDKKHSEGVYDRKGMRTFLNAILLDYARGEVSKKYRAQVKLIREVIVSIGSESIYLDLYINHPDQLMVFASKGSTRIIETNSWKNLFFHGHHWIATFVFRADRKAREFNEILKEQLQYEKDTQYILQGNGHLGDFQSNDMNSDLYFDVASNFFLNPQISEIVHFDSQKNSFHVFHSTRLDEVGGYRLVVGTNILPGLRSFLKQQRAHSILFISIQVALVLLGFLLSSLLVKPIQVLAGSFEKVIEGDYEFEFPGLKHRLFHNISLRFQRLIDSLRERENFGSFLSPQIEKRIIEFKEQVRREEATVIFCGVLGAEAQELSPEAIRSLINLFQKEIFQADGVVDKFTGTACLGVFLKNSSCPVTTSVRLLNELDALFQDGVLSTHLKVGIGLATGPVILGHIGATNRKDFTAIGNTVNMAARLEHLFNRYEGNTGILCDQDTRKNYKGTLPIKSLGKTEIKGIKEPREVFRIFP